MSISDWSSDVCSSDLFARVRRTERIAPIGEHMGRMLAPLALQHGQRDLVERNAERAAVLRVPMPDRGHAAGHIDPVPCQPENVALPLHRPEGQQHHFTLVIGPAFKLGYGPFVRKVSPTTRKRVVT